MRPRSFYLFIKHFWGVCPGAGDMAGKVTVLTVPPQSQVHFLLPTSGGSQRRTTPLQEIHYPFPGLCWTLRSCALHSHRHTHIHIREKLKRDLYGTKGPARKSSLVPLWSPLWSHLVKLHSGQILAECCEHRGLSVNQWTMRNANEISSAKMAIKIYRHGMCKPLCALEIEAVGLQVWDQSGLDGEFLNSLSCIIRPSETLVWKEKNIYLKK